MFVTKIFGSRQIVHFRAFSKCATVYQTTVSGPATPSEPLIIPPSESLEKVFSPKLEKIATDISNLNILEVSELSQLLKKRLNLPDQPMMPANFAMMAPAGRAQEDEAAEAAPVQKVKTEFTVKMKSFDEKQKVALIKEVKNLLEGYNLVQAKKFVESLPAVVKADVTKEDADKLKEALTKVGADIEII